MAGFEAGANSNENNVDTMSWKQRWKHFATRRRWRQLLAKSFKMAAKLLPTCWILSHSAVTLSSTRCAPRWVQPWHHGLTWGLLLLCKHLTTIFFLRFFSTVKSMYPYKIQRIFSSWPNLTCMWLHPKKYSSLVISRYIPGLGVWLSGSILA